MADQVTVSLRRKVPKQQEPSTGRRRAGGRRKRKAGQPKGASTAWIIFSTEIRPKLKKRYEDATFATLTRLASRRWKLMDSEDKKPYEKKAREDKKRYEREMREWRAKGGDASSEETSSSIE
eukprot:TRINITY_DN9686_c0_g1_i1.p1 TRINITY_DN9686_c0_g1~~TRINITY_DN9686_c0_g1_i1.p1  ORF type:complete len:122 (-),score=43.07 TRINITY_DN9686_c0_g1_i1:68-433(-)